MAWALAGTTSVSPSAGFASFSGLNITAFGDYTLTASASGFGPLPLNGTSSQIGVDFFFVTSTGTGNVPGTLLYAINQLDSTGGSSNLIDFDIPGSGVQNISLTSALPTITKPVTIEGTVSAGVPQIELSRLFLVSVTSGLTFGTGSSGSSVQDLLIMGFSEYGIDITSSSTGDTVLGCGIGANFSGAIDGNGYGVYVAGSGATIGGTTPGTGNVISGNSESGIYIDASSCLVEGNDIGTNGTGTLTVGGIDVVASGATIGGTAAGAGNVISGNDTSGVVIAGSSCLVEGNEIGTNAAGTAAVANADSGIYVIASGATIGGTAAGAGNVISGNSYGGLAIDASCLVEGNKIGTNAAGTAALANNNYGIYIDGYGSDATIGGTAASAGNTISDNTGVGVAVGDAAEATITNDSITADGTGILVGTEANADCLVTAQYDNLSGNTTAGITNNQTPSVYVVTATDDWWGSLNGPTTTANPGGNGTGVSSNVNFTPWIGLYTPGAGPGFQPTGVTDYAVPTQFVFVTEPSSPASPGVAFATQPVVEAEDASGNLGINFDAATVPGSQAVMTLNDLLGTGTLVGTTSVSPSGGFASFSGLNITGSGTFSLTVAASGFGSLGVSGTSSEIQNVPPTYTVTSTGTGDVSGTLPWAIDQVNSSAASSNIIDFNIGSGVQTINPTSQLPTITKPVTIEGTAIAGVPQIQILGGSAGSTASGLTFAPAPWVRASRTW